MATTCGSNASAWAEWVAGYPWTSTSILRQPQEQGSPGGSLVRSTLRYPSVPLEVTVKYCLRRRIGSELVIAVNLAPTLCFRTRSCSVLLRCGRIAADEAVPHARALPIYEVQCPPSVTGFGIGPLTWMLCLSVEREYLGVYSVIVFMVIYDDGSVLAGKGYYRSCRGCSNDNISLGSIFILVYRA